MRRMFSEKQIKEFIENQPKDITTLVDADGHERFIEGDITPKEITGMDMVYGKWSLSGSHLLIATVCSFAVGSYASGVIASFNLPAWIKNKIFTLWDTVVDYVSFTGRDSGGSSATIGVALSKGNDNTMDLSLLARQIVSTNDKTFRIVFDLLIDNE